MRTPDKYQPEPLLPIAEEAWCSIEVTLGLEQPDPDARRRIERYLILYLVGPTALPVPVSDVRDSLENLKKKTIQFRHIFEISKQSSANKSAPLCALTLVQDRREREALKLSLSELIMNIDEALTLVKNTKEDDRYKNLIQALATVYRDVTGKKPTVSNNAGIYGGKFFDFVIVVLEVVDDPYAKSHNNQAIGKKISRSLRLWRKISAQ